MSSPQGEAEELFRLAVEASPSGMIIVDRAGKIVMVNSQLERIFGYARDELLGRTLESLIPERFREIHERFRQEYSEAPEARGMGVGRRLAGLRKDGREMPVEITLNPLGESRGDQVLATVLDTTVRERERERMQEFAMELRRRNDELQQFAYVVSHDLKAPLRGIASVASWLGEDLEEAAPAETLERIQLILDRAERMRRLIEGILVYSRMGMGEVTRTPVDTRKLLEEVLESIERPVGVRVAVRGKLPVVVCDETQLYQVFLNLIGNAIKHVGRTRARVEISAERSDHAWRFHVADDGVGVPKEHRARIFELFRTLTPKNALYGTGVGLSIVKRAVEQNGGQVGVDHSGLGGADFWFTIPDRAPAEAASTDTPDPSHAAG